MQPVSAASAPPSPPAGSARYFALLYTPATLRPLLGTLLALADEISAGGARGLDHSVAHVRLDWWRAEADGFARGEPRHPWLAALLAQHPASRGLDLQPLVEAAALDLAMQTLGAQPGLALPGAKLQGAVFALAAQVLRSDRRSDALSPQLQATLGDLGERVLELERFAAGRRPDSGTPESGAPTAPAAALEALRRQAGAIDSAWRPQLAPLVVWMAVAAAQARRRARRAGRNGGSLFDGFADNMLAWNAARRAVRGRARID
jgi:hypothetical protein